MNEVQNLFGRKVSSLGCYSGYSRAEFPDAVRHSVYVTVDDGTRIALDYYIPSVGDAPARDRLPVIFHFTPYGRVMRGRDAVRLNPHADPDALYFMNLGLGDLFSFSRHGYVVAIAETRGSGASFGACRAEACRREALDGKFLVEWLAKQDFCDGRVGTIGFSYTGQTQLETIAARPEGLVASFVGMTDFNRYDGWFRDGVPRAFGSSPDRAWSSDPDEYESQVRECAAHVVPVDGDEDGELLVQAIREHRGNTPKIPIQRDLVFRDSTRDDLAEGYHEAISASSYLDDINASGVAVYLTGGVYDVFRRETVMLYKNLMLPRKLLVGPWYHLAAKESPDWTVEALRWFDYWLKGIDNGITEEPPIAFKLSNYDFARGSVTGSGTGSYRFEHDWPVQSGTRKTLYLGLGPGPDGQMLLTDLRPQKADSLWYRDPYGISTSVESQLMESDDGKGVGQVGLVFRGEPLSRDLQVIGHPRAHVRFSLVDPGWQSRDYDVDLFVALGDHDPETGKTFLVTEGHLRSSLRSSGDAPYETCGLVWRPCGEADARYLELGREYAVVIEMLPTSYRFACGHRLQVSISNSLDRMYYHGRLAFEEDSRCAKPEIELRLGGEDATRIELPDIYS